MGWRHASCCGATGSPGSARPTGVRSRTPDSGGSRGRSVLPAHRCRSSSGHRDLRSTVSSPPFVWICWFKARPAVHPARPKLHSLRRWQDALSIGRDPRRQVHPRSGTPHAVHDARAPRAGHGCETFAGRASSGPPSRDPKSTVDHGRRGAPAGREQLAADGRTLAHASEWGRCASSSGQKRRQVHPARPKVHPPRHRRARASSGRIARESKFALGKTLARATE